MSLHFQQPGVDSLQHAKGKQITNHFIFTERVRWWIRVDTILILGSLLCRKQDLRPILKKNVSFSFLTLFYYPQREIDFKKAPTQAYNIYNDIR